jgi:hypothetical protein
MIAEKGAAMVKDAAAKTGGARWGQRCLAAVRLSVSGATHPSAICDNNAPRYLALAHDVKNLLHSRAHIGLAPVTATK